MRVWPVIIDSQPSYLRGNGRSTSLLLVPFGTGVLLDHVSAAVRLITDNPPLLIARATAAIDTLSGASHRL